MYAGEELEDEHTLDDCNVKQESSLASVFKLTEKMQVFVATPTGKFFILEAKATDTIENIKIKIQQSENIPIEQQNLIFAGRELKNCQTLRDYHIQNESKLNLSIIRKGEIQIDVKLARKTIVLTVDYSDTVENVKTMINDTERIPPD